MKCFIHFNVDNREYLALFGKATERERERQRMRKRGRRLCKECANVEWITKCMGQHSTFASLNIQWLKWFQTHKSVDFGFFC